MDFLRRIFASSASAGVSESTDEKVAEGISTFTALDGVTKPIVGEVELPTAETAEIPILPGITRPLSPEAILSFNNSYMTFGLATDVGMLRTNNQDALFTFVATGRTTENQPDFGLFVVADGMGGHLDGEKASLLTVNSIASQIIQQMYLPILNAASDPERVPITEGLILAVQHANNRIIDQVPDGGTTATAVTIIGDLAYIVHVGDTRVYLITGTEIEQITRDHSLVQRLIELGQLTLEEARVHPQRNVLYRALGQNSHLEVDAITRRLAPNSRLLICSDGLWNMVSENAIRELVGQCDSPQLACEQLINMANKMGGSDNITAIVVHMPKV